jgi:HTH-type transcriptional regulator/antitoxin HigA
MKTEIKTKAEYEKVAQEVFGLMNKGEQNITKKESNKIRSLALKLQAHEQKLYPVERPKTLAGMIELKMYEKKIRQAQLAKKLKLSEAKLSLILNGKQKPDVTFLKGIRKELKIDADFILDHV